MLLKFVLRLLIKRYGLFDINDLLGEIYHEHFLKTGTVAYDLISEGYDDLNKRHITGRKLPLC